MKRIALLVEVDLDEVPGIFHTEDSAIDNTRGILNHMISHYNPSVTLAPDELQPKNDSEGTR